MLTAVLCLLPVLVLALPLLARRYPGEHILLALRDETPLRWPHPRASVAPHHRIAAITPRGGRLLGCGLAVRPPPLVGC
ncbi:MAG TPA: hypothetical protein VIC06_11025 [Solirubrobacteraceae bacterium]